MILLLAISLYVPFIRASLSNVNGTAIPALDVRDSSSSGDTRTLWDIIWSCAATLFACTWTAIHPNIPGVNEGKLAITSRRLFIMFMALITPELIITWAARQYLSARKAAIEFNHTFDAQQGEDSAATMLAEISPLDDRNSRSLGARKATDRKFAEWTVTHWFFAWMGGFLLRVNGEPRATLTPGELLDFVRNESVDMPDIMQAEIEDRSKGDALSKGIAILQLAWFVLQLVARYIQNLPITLLEVDTLAVAALTFTAYGLWWKKPKDVGRPCPVYWKPASPPIHLIYDHPHRLLCTEEEGFSSYVTKLLYPFYSLMGFESVISRSAVRSRRVPSLGGYTGTHGHIVLFVGCSSGMVFGAIHCMAWDYFVKEHTERVLWRVASLAILCAPILILFGYCYNRVDLGLEYLHHVFSFVLQLSYFAYIVARFTLIVLILVSFQSLPPGVYDTVAWTKFIPHL